MNLQEKKNQLIKKYLLSGKANIKKEIIIDLMIKAKGTKSIYQEKDYKRFKSLFCL